MADAGGAGPSSGVGTVTFVIKNPGRSSASEAFTIELSLDDSVADVKRKLQESYPGSPEPSKQTVRACVSIVIAADVAGRLATQAQEGHCPHSHLLFLLAHPVQIIYAGKVLKDEAVRLRDVVKQVRAMRLHRANRIGHSRTLTPALPATRHAPRTLARACRTRCTSSSRTAPRPSPWPLAAAPAAARRRSPPHRRPAPAPRRQRSTPAHPQRRQQASSRTRRSSPLRASIITSRRSTRMACPSRAPRAPR